MNNLLQYSNGVGHLVMSILLIFTGVFLVVFPGLDATTKGVGISLILTVSGAWFIPGAARQVAEKVQKNVSDALPPVTEVKP